ncbi:hypothetical protein C6Y14_11825 [Streptomyces dioscori]|uniref:Carboxypeptidase regulatory-like domain-containing protein n=1 Tax=Streptomyces dioscori TaxID=2109333 RepID=A0A2P8Q9E6_9ACTN|nr:carboxypeptidase-like regulatory domain-containing protein [Streptomyces dioscori]PSM42877.1 hypothetical protein C6Y14_11825 [Streptomyces dioscori]
MSSSQAVEITGTVRDTSGKPVEGAHVVFTDGPRPLPDIAAVTNDMGAFSLSAPMPGNYTLTCRADTLQGPYSTAEAAVHVAAPTGTATSAHVELTITARP